MIALSLLVSSHFVHPPPVAPFAHTCIFSKEHSTHPPKNLFSFCIGGFFVQSSLRSMMPGLLPCRSERATSHFLWPLVNGSSICSCTLGVLRDHHPRGLLPRVLRGFIYIGTLEHSLRHHRSLPHPIGPTPFKQHQS